MSSSNEGGGGCAGCACVVILLGAVALVVTNPSETAHRNVIATKTPQLQKDVGVLNTLAWFGGGQVNLQYHNCYLFSFTTIRIMDNTGKSGEAVISTGYLGQVYYREDIHP